MSGRVRSHAAAAALLASAAMLGPASAAELQPGPARPNFLVIVADDLGYSDIGAFGGEISTPNLDALAGAGVRLTDFHTAPACAPTRAMLLTGSDSHLVGQGTMEIFAPEQRGKPGYEGHLNERAATVAERLQEKGYLTLMSGKWHLGAKPEYTPASRGFERSYALLPGGHNHFGLTLNGMPPTAYSADGKPAPYPVGSYSSDVFADRLVAFIDQAKADERPIFAYLAFTAPHSPLQAPSDAIAKYRGRYDAGPKVLAQERLARMKAEGLIGANVRAFPSDELEGWESLGAAQKTAEARQMEIYAAMISNLDHNVGRVVDALKRTGRFENTTVVFLSDNGAAGDRPDAKGRLFYDGVWNEMLGPERAAVITSQVDNSLGNQGAANSYMAANPGWAAASSAPFRLYKTFTAEGGIRAPAFISGYGVTGSHRLSDAFLNVTDIAPTIMDLAGVRASATYRGRAVLQPEGKSWRPILENMTKEVRTPDEAVGWELFGGRAIRKGDWKALYVQAAGAALDAREWKPGRWQLYDLARDPGETKDLARSSPRKMKEMMAAWRDYVTSNGVVVLFDHQDDSN